MSSSTVDRRNIFKSRDGEVAVITGGSGGIGAASVDLFIKAGGKVVIADIDESGGKLIAGKYPGRSRFVRCDTRSKDDLETAINEAKKMGKFTVMFNNAGVTAVCDTLDEGLENWEILKRVVDINVNACCLGTYLALSHFSEEDGGTVITTASMAGLLPVGAPPIYSLTKSANVQFTRSLGFILGENSKRRVYALCPSYTATALAPDPSVIKSLLGGVLRPIHQAEGFMMLSEGNLPNGSVMRVTVRSRGKFVVHDLVQWGKELGGSLPSRDGILIKQQPLEEWDGPDTKEKMPQDVSKL